MPCGDNTGQIRIKAMAIELIETGYNGVAGRGRYGDYVALPVYEENLIHLYKLPDIKDITELLTLVERSELLTATRIDECDDTNAVYQKCKELNNEIEGEDDRMKAFILLIDPSASSPAVNNMYIYEADSIEDAMDKLNGLNLEFALGKIYCATIGRRQEGVVNRYITVLQTNDGKAWYRENPNDQLPYRPETWSRLEEWTNINEFRAC